MSVVTLALAKSALMVSHTAQDAYIQAILDGAEEWVAKYLDVALIRATFTEDLDGGELYLWPANRPISAVTSVTDLIGGDAFPFLLENGSRIRWNSNPVWDLPRWPVGIARWRVVYAAGYATLPPGVQMGILALVSRAYNARGGELSQSADHASINFGALAGSDVCGWLNQYRRQRMIVT